MNISEVFIRRPIATSLLMAALALVGIVAFPLLPVAPLPQVDFPTINVTATLTGASPEIMGSTVATPLEFQFGQIAGVSQMSSVSSLGSTVITLQFDLNRNIDGAAQDVQAAITAAGPTLPQEPHLAADLQESQSGGLADPDRRGDFRHDAALQGRRFRRERRRRADFADPRRGAGQIGGQQRPAIRVQVDPAKLTARGLTLEDVRGALATRHGRRAERHAASARSKASPSPPTIR